MSDKISIFVGDVNKNVNSLFDNNNTLLDRLYNGVASFFTSVKKFIDKIFDRGTTLPSININTSGIYDKYNMNVLPNTKSSGIYDKISETILRHPIVTIICSCAIVWLLTGYCNGRKRRDCGSSNGNSDTATRNRTNQRNPNTKS